MTNHDLDAAASAVRVCEKTEYWKYHCQFSDSTRDITFIMLTARSDMDSVVTAIQTGVDAYIAKPYEKQNVIDKIKKLLDSRYNDYDPDEKAHEGVNLTESSKKDIIHDIICWLIITK